jgi:hypothetical protein
VPAIGFPAKLGQAQRERLAHIDFRLWFLGEVSRADICARFGVAPAGATRDLALYREAVPGNIAFDGRTKTYRIGTSFSPLFDHPIDRVLSSLSLGFGDGIGGGEGPMVSCEFPAPITRPATDTLARVTRAVASRAVLRVDYFSASGGKSSREIVPFALADNGQRWHVRAFDRKSASFRDFVLTRILSAEAVEGDAPRAGELPEDDAQWARVVDLELVAHPDYARPELAALDYPMTDGVLRIRSRAALAGYVMRRWNVDCSPDHSLRGPEHTLWLRDPTSLLGIESAAIAPGYVSPGGEGSARG